MKITDESEDDRLGNASVVVRIDPHDGTCRGAHDIMVVGFDLPPMDRTDTTRMHVTLSWGTNALLSLHGSVEFRDALDVALFIGHQIRTTGAYTAPDVTLTRRPTAS